MLALLGLTLWLLEVRDVRCYAAALLWVPSISGVLLANVSIPLAFALAVLWRYRDRVWPPGLALGLSVSAKLRPLADVRLDARDSETACRGCGDRDRHRRDARRVGGHRVRRADGYPDLVRRLSDIQAENSYSLVGMAATAGLPDAVGRALTLVVGGGLLVGLRALRAPRGRRSRRSRARSRRRSRCRPIVWLHYLVVLLVPLAIARPRFSAIWLLPILLWVSPKPGYAEGFQTFVPAVAVVILLGVLLARPRVPARLEPAVA